MDLGKAEFSKAATTNLFHHSQVFHNDYGLVWHNGRTVFLSQLQFLPNRDQPTSASLPQTLGQFQDDVICVCWSRGKATGGVDDVVSYLCVQHVKHVSVWAVSGRAAKLRCHKQTDRNVKALPQGCLWHPRKAVLCVLSHTELHVYCAQSASWDVIQCDEKVECGCWARAGSKFFVAVGSEIKVLDFNPQEQSLEFAEDRSRCEGTSFHSFQAHASIKSITPVTDELVAITTDLPLDHLIYQSHHVSTHVESVRKSPPKFSAPDDNENCEFSLIIPSDRIVQNPIADTFKEMDKPQGSSTKSKDAECSTDSFSQGERNPRADTIGDKLDQILNLMKKIDVKPKDQGSPQHLERRKVQGNLCSQLESMMDGGGSRSGPIDITEMLKDVNNADVNTSLKMNRSRGGVESPTKPSNTQNEERDHGTDKTERTSEVESPESHHLSKLKAGNGTDGTFAAMDAFQASSGQKTSLLECEMKGQHSGPVDVTALLAAMLTAQNSSADSPRMQVESSPEDDKDAISGLRGEKGKCGNRGAKSDDVVDLTGLELNVTKGHVSQVVKIGQNRPNGIDAAKLSLLRVGTGNEQVRVTSVELPGILTPDLLHFHHSCQCFVVGTSTQRQLLVYMWHNNKLEPAEENIMLPDSHQPLGVCDIPGYPTHILVLAGESQPSDGAFLSFSSKTEMNLKLFKFKLPVGRGARENTHGESNGFVKSHSSSEATSSAPLEDDQVSSSQIQSYPGSDIIQGGLPVQMVTGKEGNLTLHEEADHGDTSASSLPAPWTSTPRYRSRIQGGWSSSYGIRQNVSGRRQVQQKESSSGVVCNSERKYPYPEDADLVHMTCKGPENKPEVLKTFLLNQQMLKLQDIKDAFGFNSVEMKIGDSWVVLTKDSNGNVPLCFHSNSNHTIKENNHSHRQRKL